MNQDQPFKPEQEMRPSELPPCPFCGTDYITAIGVASPWIGVCGENEGLRQRYKCTKEWCRTEFDIIFRAVSAENIVVPEDVVKEWREQEAAAGNDDFGNDVGG